VVNGQLLFNAKEFEGLLRAGVKEIISHVRLKFKLTSKMIKATLMHHSAVTSTLIGELLEPESLSTIFTTSNFQIFKNITFIHFLAIIL